MTVIPVYFLENGESNADENFARLVSKEPGAIRFQSTGTIFKSHCDMAESSDFPMFFVVDADAWIVDDFNFPVLLELKPKTAAVFRAKNPLNGLVYGHGAVKLFTADCFDLASLDRPDMTSTVAENYQVIHTLSNEHRFNTDAWSTWRTAFRECVKLSSGINKNNKQDETLKRLDVWMNQAQGDYSEYAISGARSGVSFADEFKDSVEDLKLVNDYNWLRRKFHADI